MGFCRDAKPASEYNGADGSQEARMAEMIIRPTMKFIYMGYVVVIVIVVASVVAMERIQMPPAIPASWQPWIPWLPVLLLLWPVKRHLRQHFIKITILDDLLRYETGILGRAQRSILISRVQDVTVRQRIGQRIFGVGDLYIETAGKTSWEAFVNFDRPREVADHINEHSQKGHAKDLLT
jgi:uncharacterized membrane protein YdbT with pleckstrin-like domain